MTLAEILVSVREFLEEPVTLVEARNVAETFENYTASAVPGSPWVTAGASGPKVETQSSQKMLKIQWNGANAAHLCGISIETQIATDSIPVAIEFDLYRAVDAAATVNICGINNNSSLDSSFAFQLLRLSNADPGVLEINTDIGWVSTSQVISPTTTYTITLWLFKEWYSVYLNGVGISITRKYPGAFVASNGTFGYLYFYGNDHATANTFINDLTSNGAPTVFGEVNWTNEELGHYGNECVAWLRAILPVSVFERYIQSYSQNTVGSTQNYALPTEMQRFVSAKFNGRPVYLISVAEAPAIEAYMASHYLGSNLQAFPQGYIKDEYLYLIPTPSGVSDLTIFYLGEVNEMDLVQPSNTEPELPNDLHKAVVWYTIIRAREKTGDDTSGPRAELEALVAGVGAKAQTTKAM